MSKLIKTVICLTFLFAVLSCGKEGKDTSGNNPSGKGLQTGDCSNSFMLGTWVGKVVRQIDKMTFNADCTGTSSYCEATFTYPNTPNAAGIANINVTSSGGKFGCLPKGTNACAYRVNGDQLSFNCGASTLTYLRAQ